MTKTKTDYAVRQSNNAIAAALEEYKHNPSYKLLDEICALVDEQSHAIDNQRERQRQREPLSLSEQLEQAYRNKFPTSIYSFDWRYAHPNYPSEIGMSADALMDCIKVAEWFVNEEANLNPELLPLDVARIRIRAKDNVLSDTYDLVTGKCTT